MAALLHDFNACRDKKFLKLRSKYGWAGYGLYWAIWEFLGETDTHSIEREEIEELALSLSTPTDNMIELIDFCVSIKLLQQDEGEIFCPGQLKRLKVFEDRREKWRLKKKKQRDSNKRPQGHTRGLPKMSKGERDNTNPKTNTNDNKSKKR